MTHPLLENITTDKYGTVMEPQLHDSTLKSIAFGEEKSITLQFNIVSGEVVQLVLGGVQRFKCDELWEGNIVLDVCIDCGEYTNLSDLQSLVWATDVETQAFKDRMNELKRQLNDKELAIFELNPSFGCTIRALVSSVRCEVLKG